jgi:hypothetical protein
VLLDLNVEPEPLELVDESARVALWRVAADEPVRTEILIGRAALEDVEAATRIEWATAIVARDPPRLPRRRAYWADRYVPLVRAAALAAWVRCWWSHLEPLRVVPRRWRPADSCWPGQIPAQEARRAAEPKRPMSTPSSATSASAMRRSTPGIVRSSSTWGPKGAMTRSISADRRSIASSR